MNDPNVKNLVVLAGPNGAGKSTVADFLIENHSISTFVNADTIAKGLHARSNDHSDIRAGRIMLEQLDRALLRGLSVAFESTMSGLSWKKLFDRAHQRRYHITICYLAVRSPEISTARVESRVQEGGHNIPQQTIVRRYHRSLELFFKTYKDLADSWYFFENSEANAVLLAMKEEGKLTIHIPELYHEYQRRYEA